MIPVAAGVVGVLKGLVTKGAEIIKEKVKDVDLAEQLSHDLEVAILDAGTQVKLQQEITAQETQRTHQAALNQSDLYTKRARPKIATESWRLSTGYALVAMFSMAVDGPMSFDPLMFGTLAGPAVFYMGMRGMEKTAAYVKGRTPDMQMIPDQLKDLLLKVTS